MATVYLAEEPKHERHLALKVLHPRLAAALGPARFLREIKTTAGLSHPHILPLFDSGEADGFLFYVMPYVDGESLRSRIVREHQLSVEDALRITREVADALGFAHTRGLIHRDVKPENILLEGEHAVLADFGVAKAITEAGDEVLTNTGLAVGTPQYMSPEQAAGSRDLDGRSDLYSLACVTYEMLTGDPPFAGSVPQAVLARKAVESASPLRHIRDTLQPHIEQAVLRALCRVPADRFATMQQFTDALLGPQAVPRRGTSGPTSKEPQDEVILPIELSPLMDELDVFGLTHPGKAQKINQDHFLIGSISRSLAIHQTSLPHGARVPRLGDRQAFVAMVADGLGRSEWGEAASRLAIEVMTQCLVHNIHAYHPASEAEEEEFMGGLREAVYQFRANVAQRAREAPTARGMAASFLMWLGQWPKAYFVQVGNCHAYLLRKGQLLCLTKGIPPGDESTPLVVSGDQEWGNVGLLCTEGLTRHVSEDQIRARLVGMSSARQACEDLLQDALNGGGTENITILIGHARALDHQEDTPG
jgi:serine/threonine protein kinase